MNRSSILLMYTFSRATVEDNKLHLQFWQWLLHKTVDELEFCAVYYERIRQHWQIKNPYSLHKYHVTLHSFVQRFSVNVSIGTYMTANRLGGIQHH
jgi:hypothetical protein